MPGCLHSAIRKPICMMRFEAPMPADMAALVTEFRALRG